MKPVYTLCFNRVWFLVLKTPVHCQKHEHSRPKELEEIKLHLKKLNAKELRHTIIGPCTS